MPGQLIQFRADQMDFGLNLQSSRNLKFGEISSGRSARFERGSGIFTGPGYRTVIDTGTSATIDGLHEGKVFPALWIKSGTKVYYSTNPDAGVKYDTGLTATTGAKTEFQEQGNGDIFVINATDAPARIAIAKSTTAIADTDIVITVGADFIDKYTASGNVLVNGDTIAYTGKSATELTGVTGIQTGGHAINSLVIQTSNPTTFTEEKGIFALELESRMIVGGRGFKKNILSASAPEDLSNPQFFYDFDGNGTVSRVLPEDLTAGIKGVGSAFIFTKNSAFRLDGFDLTTGAFLMVPITQQYGAYNQHCVCDMDGVIAFLGNKRLIPISIQLTPDAQAAPYLGEDFDHRLRPWLDALDPFEDQADAHLAWDPVQKILKIAARRNGALETYVFDKQNGNFLPQESRPGYAFSMFNGNGYFGGTTGVVYIEDMGRTNDGNAILHQWATGRTEYDKGRRDMQLKDFEYSGYMSEACEHTVRIYLDGSTTAAYSMTFDDSTIVTSSGTPIGARGVGASGIGGDAMSTLIYPYENKILLRGLSCQDFRIEFEVTKQGAFFQTNTMFVNAFIPRRAQGTYN